MDRSLRGQHEYEGLIGTSPDDALAGVRSRSPYMYDASIEGAFGGSLAHGELSRVNREIATIAILAAGGGAERQLASHTRAALHNGIHPSELRALAEHVTVYAGFPRGLNALATIDEVLTEQGVRRPFPLRRVRLSDHETVVAQAGDRGPAVLLIHALGLNWRMWEVVMTRLSAGRRVFAYDIRGHGWAAGSPSPFTMNDTADDLLGVLDALGLDRAHIVGLSYGGGIAQNAAVRSPERFASMALLATTDHPFAAFEGRARSGEVDGMAAQIVPSLTRWYTPPALAVNDWPVRYARECILRGDPTDWAAAWRAFKGIDVQNRLDAFEPPTLVLCGELDASCPPEIMAPIAERISSARYEELTGVPHMMSLERPDDVAEALDRFLPAEQ